MSQAEDAFKQLPYGAEEPARVMVIAHPPLFQQTIAAMLAVAGHQVVSYRQDEDILAQIERTGPDLIILDSKLPGLDAYQLCSQIKATESTRLTPVVMVATVREMEDKIKGLEAGADDVLRRPISRMELLARVRSLVRLKRLTDELISIDRALMALATAIEAKDQYTEAHVQRVVNYAILLGRHCGLSSQELKLLQRAAMLHDAGKLGIRETILLKPGPLDTAEWENIKAHPVLGERICRNLGQPRFLLDIVRHHHERHDGRGYPDGLAGDNIPIGARIMAIVDAYDAMTSHRPYRGPLSQAEAISILRSQASLQFDPRLVEAFLSIIRESFPAGQP